MLSTRTVVPSPQHLTSLMYSLPVRRLKDILSHVVPGTTLGPIEELSTPQLSRLYNLTMSDDRKLLLSFAPSLAVRLLRQESTIVSSEATLISFITDSNREDPALEASSEMENEEAVTLSTLIPTLLKHSSNNKEMAYPYSIFEPTSGVPLSTLSVYLSIPERRLIDEQIGSLVRSLASFTSPSGKFGMVGHVLVDPFTPRSNFSGALESKTWSQGFNTLLEGILRDGEDMSVLLPYDTIRHHFQRLSDRLDAVTTPRLVILDAGSETNVMVMRAPEEVLETTIRGIKLTGLRSWSQGVFGDPLLAACFDEPSDGFLEGWLGRGEDIIEDVDGIKVRTLLYRCYRAVVGIVTEYYRPQPDSSRRELDARRKLTSTVSELGKVIQSSKEAQKRPRALIDEMESPKRQKYTSP